MDDLKLHKIPTHSFTNNRRNTRVCGGFCSNSSKLLYIPGVKLLYTENNDIIW